MKQRSAIRIFNKNTVLLIFILIMITGGNVFGQNPEETNTINLQHLLETADTEIFVRDAFKQNFSEIQGYVNEFPNPVTVHQYYIMNGEGSDVLMTMQPSEVTVRTTNKRLNFEQIRRNEFHVTYSAARKEDIPAGAGGICWIGYTNRISQGVGKDSGVILYPGDQAYYFTHVDGEEVYESIADLSDLNPEDYTKFDFIRLNGIMYIYVDGVFRFSHDDGINDIVTFEAGSELYQYGNRIRCTFDNFSMRIK